MEKKVDKLEIKKIEKKPEAMAAHKKEDRKPEPREKIKPKEQGFSPPLFGKWPLQSIHLKDYSLVPYINLESKIVPHSFGKYVNQAHGKTKVSIVERLINKVMRSGQGKRKMSGKFIRGRNSTGKKVQAIQLVERAFDIIERDTKQNPVQVLVEAIENAAVREDTTRIKKGGVAYTVAVDVSPVKRVDEAIKNLALAGFAASFNKKVTAEEALAKEIMLTAKGDSASFSIKRRDEVERIAIASR